MKYKLIDLLDFKTQGVNTTTDHISYVEKGYKIVQAKNIAPYNITFDESNFVDEKTFSRIKDNHKLHKGEVLYTNIGSQLGNSAIYEFDDEAIITWNVMKLIPNKDIIDNNYLCYLLNSNKPYIKALNTSSTMPFVSGKALMNVEFEVPDLQTQKKVIKVLKNIEDKIKLNNEINNNLYEIASSLINEALVNSDKIKLNEIISFVKGKKPLDISEEYKEGYEKYLTIACLNNQENMYADPTKTLLTESDILMVMDGASSGDVYFSDKGIVGSTLSKIEICNEEYIPEYVFFALKRLVKSIQEKTTGSAIPHTDKVFVGNLEIPKLDMEEQLKYKSLIAKIIENNKQNNTLSNLRDTLLPKLMNGEIDLDNIEI